MALIAWEIPIKTVSEANCTEHWTKKSKRHKQQQFFVKLSYEKNVRGLMFPCDIKLTRLAPRLLDGDNLIISLKWVRDELSECVFPEKRSSYVAKNGKTRQIKGRADDDPRITWNYAQEKNPLQGIRIEINF